MDHNLPYFLSHKSEYHRAAEGPRPEVRPNVLQEGNASPYKICLVLLLREHYGLVRDTKREKERTLVQQMGTLKCLYDLTSIPDLSFNGLKNVVQDPKYSIRPEVIQSALGILQELDGNNATFLLDFANTMLEINENLPSLTILKKKIGKESPFGKYVRMVLLTIKKMSHAQLLHTYKELCLYLGLVYNLKDPSKSFVELQQPPSKKRPSVGPIQEILTVDQKETIQTIQTESIGEVEGAASMEISLSDTQIEDDDEVEMDVPPSTLTSTPATGLSKQKHQGLPPDTLEFPSPNTSSVGIAAEVEVKTILSTPASITKSIGFIFDKMEKMVPYDQALTFNSQTLAAPLPNRDSSPKRGLDLFEEMRRKRVENNMHGIGPNFCTNFTKNLEDLRKRSKTREKRRFETTSDHKTQAKGDALDEDHCLGTNPRFWNRRVIESTVDKIINDMSTCLTARAYSSKQISMFVAQAKDNPNARCLLPQLYFLEYLSNLQIKDIGRATEALRASYDHRIKPTTSELNKGVPYAPFQFAVLYNRLGYKKDAKVFLEEAFQSGHSAGDDACLDHCQNLWSQFEGVPCKELLTPRKEASENGVSHLYVSKAISTLLEDLRNGKRGQLSLINDLFGCTLPASDVELDEILSGEAVQLGTLVTVLLSFGWFKLAKLSCSMIIQNSKENSWSNQTYCLGLCSMAELLYMEGDTHSTYQLFDSGRVLFEKETSDVGEQFNKHFALFQARASYLASIPVPDRVLATLAAFDFMYSLYWLAYNKMIYNDYNGASKALKRLSKEIASKKPFNFDLKLRCLLLQAKVYCQANTASSALPYLFEAYDLATKIHADEFIVLAVLSISAVQHRLDLHNMASRTLQTNIQSLLRCNCKYLKASYNLLNVKLFLSTEKSVPTQFYANDAGTDGIESERQKDLSKATVSAFILNLLPNPRNPSSSSSCRRNSNSSSSSTFTSPRTTRRSQQHRPVKTDAEELQEYKNETVSGLLKLLEEAEETFRKWRNSYRLKEILHLKIVVYEFGQKPPDEIAVLQRQFESIETHLIWNVETCVV